jgi:peroxiredoxin 2/4
MRVKIWLIAVGCWICLGLCLTLLTHARDVPTSGPSPADQMPKDEDLPRAAPDTGPGLLVTRPFEESPREVSIPLIGEDAPSFSAETTQGPIRFPENFRSRWVILFSHPADFTPVCTTEFMTFAKLMPRFQALDCSLVGLSIDSTYSHIAWLRTIREKIKYKDMADMEVTFPVIADVKMEVARKYGMLHPPASDTKAVRAVFFIDPKSKVRAILYYPQSNGRNFQEILRLLIAMQTSDANQCATPADWQPGDDVIVPPPGSCGAANERVEQAGKDYYCLDWFLCLRKLPKEQLKLP